jgi:glycyl-tRNA synthetase beta chain
MRTHQKYFSTLLTDENPDELVLAPYFITVSNMQAADGGLAILSGNQRVLRARLSDAAFFWDQDRKVKLVDRVDSLEQRVFFQGLGTVLDKAKRLEYLAGYLAKFTGGDRKAAERAGLLAKADLSSDMVGEFPELQGIMGRYYALHDKEPVEVASAIADHYSPAGPSDKCPTAPVSVAVALADRIDTLVGFFAINEKPTGSKDPFALRRAALGVIRLIVENNLRLGLNEVFAEALEAYKFPFGSVRQDLLDFFADRLKVHLKDQGVRHDLVAAVFSLGSEDDLVRLLARVAALSDFVNSEDGVNLLAAYRRAVNIVRIEEKKDGASILGDVEDGKLVQDEERDLVSTLKGVRTDVRIALESEDFTAAMAALSRLRQPVDAFFDKVTVNADDPVLRMNRLRLLSEIGRVMELIANFAVIEG